MKKHFLVSLFFFALIGQSQDLPKQLGLMHDLLPTAEKLGIMVGKNDLPPIQDSIAQTQTNLGVTFVTLALKDVKQKVAQYLRMAASGAIKNHGIKALLIIEGQDIITKNEVGVKVTCSEAQKLGVPVFVIGEKNAELGYTGRFVLKDGNWILQIQTEMAQKLGLVIPAGNSGFELL